MQTLPVKSRALEVVPGGWIVDLSATISGRLIVLIIAVCVSGHEAALNERLNY